MQHVILCVGHSITFKVKMWASKSNPPAYASLSDEQCSPEKPLTSKYQLNFKCSNIFDMTKQKMHIFFKSGYKLART